MLFRAPRALLNCLGSLLSALPSRPLLRPFFSERGAQKVHGPSQQLHGIVRCQAGYYDVGIGAGVETMTLDPMKFDDKLAINPKVLHLHSQQTASLDRCLPREFFS